MLEQSIQLIRESGNWPKFIFAIRKLLISNLVHTTHFWNNPQSQKMRKTNNQKIFDGENQNA